MRFKIEYTIYPIKQGQALCFGFVQYNFFATTKMASLLYLMATQEAEAEETRFLHNSKFRRSLFWILKESTIIYNAVCHHLMGIFFEAEDDPNRGCIRKEKGDRGETETGRK